MRREGARVGEGLEGAGLAVLLVRALEAKGNAPPWGGASSDRRRKAPAASAAVTSRLRRERLALGSWEADVTMA